MTKEKKDFRILIADDSQFMRNLVKDNLVEDGFNQVSAVTSGNDAIELFKIFRPDLVLLDINMSNGNGFIALEGIMDFDPHAKCIMISALDQDDLREQAKKLGVIDYIAKPFKMDMLIDKINRIHKGD